MMRRWMLSLLVLVGLAGALPAAAAPFASDRITVRTEGRGRDVVLIPGLTSSPDAWRDVVAKLPGHRFHLVQVKGFAGTPAVDTGGPVLPALAAEIARYMAEAKLRAPVAGHSMGGSVALLLAERHPAVVERLMVVDMPAFLGGMIGGPGTTAEKAAGIGAAMAGSMRAASEADYQKRLAAQFGAMARNPQMQATALAQAKASDRTLTATAMGELVGLDLRPGLPAVRVPVTILYVTPAGVPLTDAQVDGFYRADYAGLPRARLVRVPAAAHFIMADNPAFFADQFKLWMAQK